MRASLKAGKESSRRIMKESVRDKAKHALLASSAAINEKRLAILEGTACFYVGEGGKRFRKKAPYPRAHEGSRGP